MTKIFLTEEEKKYLHDALLLDKKSLIQISQEMGYSTDTLTRLSKEIMGKDFNLKRKSYLNEKYFNEIVSKEQAYWLGFLAADGYIVKNEICIQLQLKDKEHLQKFSDAIKGNLTIREIQGINNFNYKYHHCRVSFRSTYMVNQLKDKGIFPKKSLSLTYPQWLKKELQPYWILGYMDGDGCISQNKEKVRISFTGTLDVLENIKKYLKSNAKIRKEHKCKQTFSLQLENDISFEFLTNINYINLPFCLERKKEKFLALAPL